VAVFAIAAGISVVVVLVGVLFQDELASVVGDILSWVLKNLGWLSVLLTAAFLILVGFLAFSRHLGVETRHLGRRRTDWSVPNSFPDARERPYRGPARSWRRSDRAPGPTRAPPSQAV
jgi:hypothetical protein